jgi:hypothetical protein
MMIGSASTASIFTTYAWTRRRRKIARNERPQHDVVGIKKTMPVNKPDDLAVTLRQLDGCNLWNTFEAGSRERIAQSCNKASWHHRR